MKNENFEKYKIDNEKILIKSKKTDVSLQIIYVIAFLLNLLK